MVDVGDVVDDLAFNLLRGQNQKRRPVELKAFLQFQGWFPDNTEGSALKSGRIRGRREGTTIDKQPLLIS